jgi:hypothetical protein
MEEWPYPTLRTSSGSFILVATEKRGLSEFVKGMQGKNVQLKGTLIERGSEQMLEVVPESLRITGTDPIPDTPIDLGPITLRGEIVDSKCFLGVMNPGSGKVHRDCAARCISGGAPPAFVAHDEDGKEQVLLLVGRDGRQLNKEVLDFVGEPLTISGELARIGSHLVLKAEPNVFRR